MGLHGRGMVLWLLVSLLVIFTCVHICVTKFNQDLGQQQSVAVLAVKQTSNISWQVNVMNHTANIDAAPFVQWTRGFIADSGGQWQDSLQWVKGEYQTAIDKASYWWQQVVNNKLVENEQPPQ